MSSVIDRFCRCCFKFYTPGEKFQQLECSTEDQPTYKRKLQCLVPEMVLNDKNQYVICEPCTESLDSFFTFYQLCVETEVKFSHLKTLQTPNETNDLEELPEDNNCTQEEPKSLTEAEILETACKTLPELAKNTPESLECYVLLAPIKPVEEPETDQENDDLEQRKCQFCSFRCISKYQLTEHLRTHKPCYTCENCNKGFYRLSNYTTHRKKVHNNRKKRPSKPTVKREETIDKNEEQSFKMLEMNEVTPEIFQRIANNRYFCSLCNHYFSTKDHINAHTNAKPYSCPLCDVRFGHRHSLSRHVRKQHGSTLTMLNLSLEMASKDPLDTSLDPLPELDEVSSTTNQSSTFTCQICKVLVIGKSALVDHMGVHVLESQQFNEVAETLSNAPVDVCFIKQDVSDIIDVVN